MLTARNVITTVQHALVEAVDLALGKRFEVPSIEALRQFAVSGTGSRTIADRALCYCRAVGYNFRFDLYSTLADDGETAVKPADRGTKPGRWRRCDLAAPYGRFRLPLCRVPPTFVPREPSAGLSRYAKAVALYEGDADEETTLERIMGAPKPAFLLKWEEDDPHPRTNRPGCMYFGPQTFSVLVIAQHNRPGAEALQGSPLAVELERDGPGLNRMIGDLRYVLAGAQLGLGPWVERVEIGRASLIVEDLAQRFFMAAAGIQVFCSYHLPEEEMEPIELVAVQPALASQPEVGLFPTDNYVRAGFSVPLGPGLTRTPDPGLAHADGAIIRYTPTAITFAASTDTYLDLQSDGTLVLHVVTIDTLPPPLAGVLRVACVRTDATGVVDFHYLCPALINWRGPYMIS